MTNRLDAERIRAPISELLREQLDNLEVFAEIGSTNSYLLDQPAPLPGRLRVALAEHQTAGRGRMGRHWHSAGASGLCLSMSYTFASGPKLLPCLTLAIGVGVARSLEELGATGIGLKWPNDLVARDGKLGGILTEVRSSSGDEVTIVTGVGINFDLGDNPDARRITSRLGSVSDLASCMQDLPSRSAVAAAIIEGLFNTLAEFESEGFEKTAAAWEKYDWLRGQKVSVDHDNARVTGVCHGIDTVGALILQTDTGTRRVTSGSVSLGGQTGGMS